MNGTFAVHLLVLPLLGLSLVACGRAQDSTPKVSLALQNTRISALGVNAATRNLPSGGTTLSFVGQTAPDLDAYKNQVLSDASFPRPSGVTLYANIAPGSCNGVSGPCNLGGNVTDFPKTLAQYPGAALAVGLYLSDSGAGCGNQPLRALIGRNDADLAGGLGQQYRANLDNLLTYLKGTNRAVFLRIGYEFDGPWNCYNSDFYKSAFRYVKGRIDALGASKIATVWQSATYPQDGSPEYHQDFSNPAHLDAFYPGDDVVDWVGFSAFYWNNSWTDYAWAPSCNQAASAAPEKIYGDLLNFASAHNKAVMLAESTPQGYRTRNLDASCVSKNARVALPGVASLTKWYDAYFNYLSAHKDQIRGAAYINSDWEAIAQFNCAPGSAGGSAGCTDGYWGNSRIQDNAAVLSLFKTRLGQLMTNGGGGNGNGGVGGGSDLGDGLIQRIQNVSNNLCWDVAGGATGNGVAVTQWTCLQNTANTNQDWKLRRVNTAEGVFYQFVAQHSGRCADIAGISKATEAKLNQWDCHANPDDAGLRNQHFALRPNPDGSYTFVLKHSGQCADVPGGRTTLGLALQQYTCNTLAPQHFRLIATSHPGGTGNGGGSVTVPGVVTADVGSLANGSAWSWTLTIPASGNYKVLIASTGSQNSQLLNVKLGSQNVDQAISTGQTLTVYFSGVPAGNQTLTLTARSAAIRLGKIEVQRN